MQLSRKESVANKLRQEEEWLSRSPKARTGKSRYRSEQVTALRKEYEDAASATKEQKVSLDLRASGRETKRLAEMQSVSFAYGQNAVINNASVSIHRQQRIGLLGRNGTGKTTLLKLISSELLPAQGVYKQAPDLQVVYFSQQREELVPERTVRRTLAESGDSLIVRGQAVHVASWAARFGFDGSYLDVPVSTLSGGERARLLIARLVLKEADVLLLDEPTNDLDLQTIEALEDSLESYAGAVVLVSHDRFLLENICDFFYGIDQEGRVERYGSYCQWEKQVLLGQKSKSNESQEKAKQESKTHRPKRTYKEQKEFESIEERVAQAEAKAETLAKRLEAPEVQIDAEKLASLYQEREETLKEVDSLYARWAELDQKG
jgi:ATP-binding cassette subfamily F protein uup